MRVRTLFSGLLPLLMVAGCGIPQEKYDADIAALTDEVARTQTALEDANALRRLTQWSRQAGAPLAFDPEAYAVSSSKLKSATFFEKLKLPIPLAWPGDWEYGLTWAKAGVRLNNSSPQRDGWHFPGVRGSCVW